MTERRLRWVLFAICNELDSVNSDAFKIRVPKYDLRKRPCPIMRSRNPRKQT